MNTYQEIKLKSTKELLELIKECKSLLNSSKKFLDANSNLELQYKRIIAEERKAKSLSKLDELKERSWKCFLNTYIESIRTIRRNENKYPDNPLLNIQYVNNIDLSTKT